MIPTKELESAINLAPLLMIPLLAGACLVDCVFDYWLSPINNWIVRYLILCVIIGALFELFRRAMNAADKYTNYLLAKIYLDQLVGFACIAVGLAGVFPLIAPEFPRLPLNPLWHFGLFCSGVTLIKLSPTRLR